MDKVQDLTLRDVRKKALDGVYAGFESAAVKRTKGYDEQEKEQLREIFNLARDTYVKVGLLTREEVYNQLIAAYMDYGFKVGLYAVGLAFNKDLEEGAEMNEDDFTNYFYTDYESAKAAFEEGTKEMTGNVIPLAALRELAEALSDAPEWVAVRVGHKTVRFKVFDEAPDETIFLMNDPIDKNYFQEEEMVECGDGEETE